MEIILTEHKDKDKNPWLTLSYAIVTEYRTYKGHVYVPADKRRKGNALRETLLQETIDWYNENVVE